MLERGIDTRAEVGHEGHVVCAGVGVRRACSDEVIQAVDDVVHSIAVLKDPDKGLSKLVEQSWGGTKTKREALIQVPVALPLDSKEMPVLTPNREKAESVLQVHLTHESAWAKSVEDGDGGIYGAVS